jgi:hypothetical protein
MFEVGDKVKFGDQVYTVIQVSDNAILIEVNVVDDKGYKVKWPQWVSTDVVEPVNKPKRKIQVNKDKEVDVELGVLPDSAEQDITGDADV